MILTGKGKHLTTPVLVCIIQVDCQLQQLPDNKRLFRQIRLFGLDERVVLILNPECKVGDNRERVFQPDIVLLVSSDTCVLEWPTADLGGDAVVDKDAR